MTSKAYLETTILADLLLKPGTAKEARAKALVGDYQETLLPVYSIKEMKAGALERYANVHAKLVQTGSLRDTLKALSAYSSQDRRKATGLEALTAAAQLESTIPPSFTPNPALDEELADRYRLALASLIVRSWRKRRRIATRTVEELDCYTEAAPRIAENGLFDLKPQLCNAESGCSLAAALKARPEVLKALRDSIPQDSNRDEDKRRRKALKQLISHPGGRLERESCRDLGDAIFAFFCPAEAEIVTTNLRDLKPLAQAVGKVAKAPKRLPRITDKARDLPEAIRNENNEL